MAELLRVRPDVFFLFRGYVSELGKNFQVSVTTFPNVAKRSWSRPDIF